MAAQPGCQSVRRAHAARRGSGGRRTGGQAPALGRERAAPAGLAGGSDRRQAASGRRSQGARGRACVHVQPQERRAVRCPSRQAAGAALGGHSQPVPAARLRACRRAHARARWRGAARRAGAWPAAGRLMGGAGRMVCTGARQGAILVALGGAPSAAAAAEPGARPAAPTVQHAQRWPRAKGARGRACAAAAASSCMRVSCALTALRCLLTSAASSLSCAASTEARQAHRSRPRGCPSHCGVPSRGHDCGTCA